MLKVREDRNDLVLVTKGGNKGTNGVRILEIMEKFQLIEYADRAACYVYFLNGNISRSSSGRIVCAVFGWRRPFGVFSFLNIPVILILVIEKVFSLVDCRECS